MLSLDYSLNSVEERLAYVSSLDLSNQPPAFLERCADYILCGKDPKLLSSLDRKEILRPSTRHDTYNKARPVESIEDLAENDPNFEARLSPQPRYTNPAPKILPEDSDLPGMRQLQERIAIYDNLLKSDAPLSSYRRYQLKHILIDLRRHQYYLKDAYKPTIHFTRLTNPERRSINLSEDTGLWLSPEDWCERKRHPKSYDLPQPALEDAPADSSGKLYWRLSSNEVNYENPAHIRHILRHYAALLCHSYEDLESEARAVCWDIEQLIEIAKLTDLEQYLLEQYVAHHDTQLISVYLAQDGIDLTREQIRDYQSRKIPKKLAQAATLRRITNEAATGKLPTQFCGRCHRKLPLHSYYFWRASHKPTGFYSTCKECSRKRGD